MSQHLLSVFINLVAAAIGGLGAWSWRKLRTRQRRYQRLRKLQEAATSGEVAICIRVGGFGDPVPDVLKYLREHQPDIGSMIAYRVSAEEAESSGGTLDNPAMAHRIIEDICDGIRAYGKGEITKVHFFPAGMVAYPLVLGAMLGNWCPVVVYHRTRDTYVALYEMNKDWIQKGKQDFEQLQEWEVLSVSSSSNTPMASIPRKEISDS